MSGHTLEFFPNYNAGRPETPGEWARAREAEGWHGLAASDHFVTMHLSYPHLWVALTEMALSTGTIPITSSFANNLFRSPVEFAQAALTLQRVSNGRFEAGLGAGWIEDEIVRIGWRFPDGPERAGRYIEAMQIVRELLQTGRCRFAGRHYQIDIDEPGFSSLAPNPPRLVGSAGGPRTLREIPRFVDRLEIQPNASATRGGSVDLVRSAAIEEADVVDAVARVPNIVVIWGDDIGQFNVSAYNMGMMGYRTPNIDSIGRDGALFTDWYGQQSCTAGRAAFITGQSPIRTGLTKVGLPGAPEGMKKEDPTIATLLKAQGYMTGQFGKNHLGDRDEMLPTAHGFDEFYGNLYHLNAEEEPENVDYPKDPAFKKRFGPRGVIHSFAGGKITDTGPLTRKRMETIDDEVTEKALDFLERAQQADKPVFLWYNSTRMHIWTHLKEESKGKTGLGVYPDGMVEHDAHVGQVLAKLTELGMDENTIVMYATDNGAETMSWPDGGTTMFRGEKNTNWEGGYRVPCLIRWPGVIKPGTIINDIGAHEDMLPTLLAAAGDTTVIEDLKKGRKIGDTTYRVHLDGHNLMPAFQGNAAEWPRKDFIYWTDDGNVAALRYGSGRWSSSSSAATASTSGRSPSSPSAFPSFSTSVPIPSSAPRDRHGLRALVRRAHVHDRPGRRLRRPVAAELSRVPAAAEAGELQPRSRDGGGDGELASVTRSAPRLRRRRTRRPSRLRRAARSCAR
jgi:arylsulfatase A-like enzyme